MRPAAELRARVVAEAARRRPPTPDTGAHARAYAHAVAGLDVLLRTLAPAHWERPVVHAWDVRGTVAHLMAGDGVLCPAAGVAEALPVPAVDWAERSRRVLAANRETPYAEVHAMWRAQAHALLACPAAHTPDPAPVDYAGRDLTLGEAYLARGFETWLHADDIGRAVGRPAPEPADAVMPALVGLGVALLGTAETAARAALVLTGPGGTDTVLGDGPPAAELTLSTSDFCRLLGGNRTSRQIGVTVRGDRDHADLALATIAALAIL